LCLWIVAFFLLGASVFTHCRATFNPSRSSDGSLDELFEKVDALETTVNPILGKKGDLSSEMPNNLVRKYGIAAKIPREKALHLLGDSPLKSILEKMPENLDNWENYHNLHDINQALWDKVEKETSLNGATCGCGNCGFGNVCGYSSDFGCMCSDGYCECCC